MALTIVACVTSTVDGHALLEIERGALAVDETSLPRVLNPADANALEVALCLRDLQPGSRVVAASAGPPLQESALREAIAQGADEVMRLWDDAFTGSDCLGIARILAAAVAELSARVVVCGELSLDGGSGVVGAQAAELLGLPIVDGVAAARLNSDGNCLLTERRTGGGFRTIERTPLPALITVTTGANVPRYPTLRSRLHSRSAVIPCWDIANLSLKPSGVGEAGAVLQRTALRRPPPDPRGLVDPSSDLPAEQRYMIAISGGVQERGSGLTEGPPDKLAGELARYLEQGSYLQR